MPSRETTRQPDTASPAREVAIDFLHLDLNTCARCIATSDTLDEALAALAPVFRLVGVAPQVNRITITTRELAEQYQFRSSPTIRVGGVDICGEATENHCDDCSDLAGCSTMCRVFVWQDRQYEQPPAAMIVDGILRVLYAPPTASPPEPYVLPDNLATYFDGRTTTMKTIAVFEPALCCNTGVCGPDPAQELVTFTADLDHLLGLGATIARHNLANDPMAFAQSDAVRRFLETAGSEGLPVTLVDGAVALTGRYPSRAELLRYAGLETGVTASSGCCEGANCGCGEPVKASSGCCEGSDCGCGEPATASSGCCEGANCGCGEPASTPAAAGCGCGC